MKKIIVLACLLLAVPFGLEAAELKSWAGQTIPAGGDCANATHAPDSDEPGFDDWAPLSGSDLYLMIDDARGSENDAEYIYDYEWSTAGVDYVVFASIGSCNVNSVVVYLYGWGTTNAADIEVDISDDASSWESVQTVTTGSGAWVEDSTTFTTLGWTGVENIYVRFATNENNDNTLTQIGNLAIEVNP